MEQCMEKLTHTSALRLFRLPRSSQLLRCLGPDWYEPHHGDFHLVVPQTSSQHGGNKQHPTVLEALALQVPAHGPKVNLDGNCTLGNSCMGCTNVSLGCYQPSSKERMGPITDRDWTQFKYFGVLHCCQSNMERCRGPNRSRGH